MASCSPWIYLCANRVLENSRNQLSKSIIYFSAYARKWANFNSGLLRWFLQMNTCVAQAIKTSAENRHLTISLERTALEISNTEKELKWLRSAVGSSEKEYEQTQQKISELRTLLEHERLGFCCKLIVQCPWFLVIRLLPLLFPGVRGGGLKNNMKRWKMKLWSWPLKLKRLLSRNFRTK